jgi:hypothetical protein
LKVGIGDHTRGAERELCAEVNVLTARLITALVYHPVTVFIERLSAAKLGLREGLALTGHDHTLGTAQVTSHTNATSLGAAWTLRARLKVFIERVITVAVKTITEIRSPREDEWVTIITIPLVYAHPVVVEITALIHDPIAVIIYARVLSLTGL